MILLHLGKFSPYSHAEPVTENTGGTTYLFQTCFSQKKDKQCDSPSSSHLRLDFGATLDRIASRVASGPYFATTSCKHKTHYLEGN